MKKDGRKEYEEFRRIKEEIKKLQEAILENEQKVAIIESIKRKSADSFLHREAQVSTME